jgi:hypothetical protein
MANLDATQSSYNKYTGLSQISYNIASYLMDNDDTIWRLLKYNSPDAWNENKCANLTKLEKGALIWKGVGQKTDYRLFFDVGPDDAFVEETSILRIYPIDLMPYNYVHGKGDICFAVYSHFNLSTMTNYATRNMFMIERLIGVLNGADISGIGRIFFDARSSSRCKVSIASGTMTMKGLMMVMSSNATG